MFVALSLLLAASGARAGSGGPDAFGYTWTDVAAPSGCSVQTDAFQLANSASFGDPATGGTTPNIQVDLGFPFPFYNQVTTQAWLNGSGIVFFHAPTPSIFYPNEGAIPLNDGVGGMLAAHWAALSAWRTFPQAYWQQFPTYFLASFNQFPPNVTQVAGNEDQWQVYLYDTGDIRVEYLAMHPEATGTAYATTLGIENFAENIGLQVFKDGVASGGTTFPSPAPFAVCYHRPRLLDCTVATPISCGVTNGASPATLTRNCTTYGCNTATAYQGKERTYSLTLTELSDLNVTLSNVGARNMAVFIVGGCSEFPCLGGGGLTASASTLAPGTYDIVVDAVAARDEGTFTLNVQCTPLSTPIRCEEALSGDTTGQPNRLSTYACLPGDFSGPEQFYSVNFTPPGNLNVTLSSSTGQGVFILSGTGPLDPTQCLAGGIGGASLFAPAAGKYLVAVDGPPASAGAYTVALACAPAIHCTPGAGALACNQQVTGTTVGEPAYTSFYACTPGLLYSGPEQVYTFTNPVQQVVSFILDDSADPRLDLILLASCNEGDCLQVADNQLSKKLDPGTYYLVVDGQNGAAAPYTLSSVCGKGIQPATISLTGAPGECFDEHKTAWLTPDITKADVVFAIDLTGSMADERAALQSNMQDIINRLQTFIPDVGFGLISFMDYPSVSGTNPCTSGDGIFGTPGDYAYRLQQSVTTDRPTIINAVNNLPPIGNGGDAPEAYSRALYETYSDPGIGWRPGARKLVVDFGDELPHDCNVLQCLGDTSTYGRGLDPGRDAAKGTADDLPIMTVIQGMVANQEVLLHLDSSGVFSPPSPTEPNYTYTQIWQCWAAMTGGEATTLNSDGTVPSGIDLAQLVGDLVGAQGAFCRDLKLVASPGYDSWLVSATPVYTDVRLPAVEGFDIRICVPPGTPTGPYDFEVQLLCSGGIVVSQEVHVDVVLNCAPSIVSVPSDHTICLGDSTLLDASGMTLVNCPGTVDYQWIDEGTGATVATVPSASVSPGQTTAYDVTVSCSSNASCAANAREVVNVEAPPLVGTVQATDMFTCNLGIQVSWDPATFRDPSASGVYNVYRSEVSCADALTRPPVVTGLTTTTWVDPNTRSGRSYFYVVEAEDARIGTTCVPQGPHNGGAVARTCTASSTTDVADQALPAWVGNILRVHHVVQQVTVDWSLARPLLPNEHFHLLKTRNDPRTVFSLANPEGDMTRTFTETDTTAPLQFFDLRVANACEEQSLDEFPPGSDDRDRDGVANFWDNCPDVYNPTQTDSDGNGIGDACQ